MSTFDPQPLPPPPPSPPEGPADTRGGPGAPGAPGAPAAVLKLGPNESDLYLLVVGVLIGLLLGPLALGRIAPNLYDRMFVGSGVPVDAQGLPVYDDTELERGYEEKINRLKGTGVTDVAIQEFTAELQAQRTRVELQRQAERTLSRQQHLDWLTARGRSLVLAIVLLMVLESVLDPAQVTLRSRVASARYAIAAVWVALLLAQPKLLVTLPLAFVLLLLAVALGAVLIPLTRLNRT